MKKGWPKLAVFLTVALLVLIPLAALASDVSGALWRGVVRVTNSGNTTATTVSTNMTLSVQGLIDAGYADNATDIALQSGGSDIPFMPGYLTNPWIIYVNSIGAGLNIDLDLYTGNVTGGMLRYFPGAGGFTVDDAPSLELGDSFEIEQKGLLGTAFGYNITLASKPGAFRAYRSAVDNITVEITGGANVTASGVSNDQEIIWKVTSDGIDLKIFVDDVEKDSTAMTANVTDNGNDWVFLENYAMIYMEYTRVWSSE